MAKNPNMVFLKTSRKSEYVVRYYRFKYSDTQKLTLKTSEDWKGLKEKALQRDEGCVVCGYLDADKEKMELHHKYYFKDGNEDAPIDKYELQDVTILCHRCHGKVHAKRWLFF